MEGLTDGINTLIQGNSVLADRFEVRKVLGAGSSSRVCQVFDRQTQKVVALKILVNTNAFEENTIQRFIEEFHICKLISHPNIVATYDLIELGTLLAFSVEYVEGVELSTVIEATSLRPEEIDSIYTQLLSALGELHKQNIIHRDIKPENIILRNDGVIKVVDLGLMKRLDQPGLTKPGIILGTAQYLPPEYVREGLHDARGDLYAAGMVLYELVSGKRRLRNQRATEVLQLLDRTDFALPEVALAGLPKRYATIIRKSLAVNPDERYQSAEEMLQAFAEDYRSVALPEPGHVTPSIDLGAVAKVQVNAPARRAGFSKMTWFTLTIISFMAGLAATSLLL